MFNLHHKADLQEIERFSCALTEANAKLEAISRSMAMIEFTPEGIVLDANENFCKTMGYSADEVRGKHHRVFCEEVFYRSEEYAKLWRDLARGEPVDPARIYFRCQPLIETAAERFAWVNERVFLGTGLRLPDRVIMRFFAVE